MLQEAHNFVLRLRDLHVQLLAVVLGHLDPILFQNVDDLLELMLALFNVLCSLKDIVSRLARSALGAATYA